MEDPGDQNQSSSFHHCSRPMPGSGGHWHRSIVAVQRSSLCVIHKFFAAIPSTPYRSIPGNLQPSEFRLESQAVSTTGRVLPHTAELPSHQQSPNSVEHRAFQTRSCYWTSWLHRKPHRSVAAPSAVVFPKKDAMTTRVAKMPCE